MSAGKTVISITVASLLLSVLFLYLLQTDIGKSTSLYVARLRRNNRKDKGLGNGTGLDQRFPGAIIVGISKCGTHALMNFLTIHPGVSCGTDEKPLPEVNFFSHHYDKGLEWYRKQMPPSRPGQVTMEKSPRYFNFQEAPERIRQFNTSMKLIVVACDPVFRFESQTAQNMINANHKRKTFRAIDDRAWRAGYDMVHNNSELWRGCYYNGMANLYKNFPSSQIFIVDGDKLRDDPYLEMVAVESFLGIDKFYTKSNFYFNKSKGFYCPAANGLIMCLGDHKGRTHQNMSPTVEKSVREFYKVCNKPFLNLVNRTFDWF